jgi:hypothetical protein
MEVTMNNEKYYRDATLGMQTRNPLDEYIPPPRMKDGMLGAGMGGSARREEEPGMAWWPIVLAVLVALMCATGCRPPSARELKAMATAEPTYKVTLLSATGDTLYHCPCSSQVWFFETNTRVKCGEKYDHMTGTVVVRED